MTSESAFGRDRGTQNKTEAPNGQKVVIAGPRAHILGSDRHHQEIDLYSQATEATEMALGT